MLFHAADQNEEAKECFKYDVLNEISEAGTIDCNSAAVENGTTDVKCYRIVFNMDLTADVSYNGFQLSMVLLNLATGAVLTLAISNLYLITF